jgi:hypothetical protein
VTDELTLEEVALQVAYLSRVVSEMAAWIAEVEKSEAVPPGQMARIRDLAELERVSARIEALQEALNMPTLGAEKSSLRDLLESSLARQRTKADELRRRLNEKT